MLLQAMGVSFLDEVKYGFNVLVIIFLDIEACKGFPENPTGHQLHFIHNLYMKNKEIEMVDFKTTGTDDVEEGPT